MAYYRRGLSLSPGNEQILYWGCDGVEAPGTRNWMGMSSPAAEAMIDTMLNADDARGLRRRDPRARPRADGGALRDPDLCLQRQPHRPCRELHYPERLPMYGDWIGWQPDVWWWDEE